MAKTEHLAILWQGVAAWNKWREQNPGGTPDLSDANLSRANLSKVDLSETDLTRANLFGAGLSFAHFTFARLAAANLAKADLYRADFSHAELSRAKLSGASLSYTILMDTGLRAAKIGSAVLGNTILAGVDLSEALGLDAVVHDGPSFLGIDTLYLSRGNIPEVFLRGCGVPENLITYMHSLTGKAFEFYSCFISHSSKDQQFADRLHADLQDKGVRCWFAPEDLKIGDRLHGTIEEAIRIYDKLLLILSKHSVESAWVEEEVRRALAKEKKKEGTVLFPVSIDNTVTKTTQQWAHDIRRDRHIGDFRQWKDHDEYQKAFQRLLRDLQAGAGGGKASETNS